MAARKVSTKVPVTSCRVGPDVERKYFVTLPDGHICEMDQDELDFLQSEIEDAN
jgi:hypothetical protein